MQMPLSVNTLSVFRVDHLREAAQYLQRRLNVFTCRVWNGAGK
jgi:hypothetical protein